MFGRFFLLGLSLVSLTWIVLVGYDLLDKKEFISPELIFRSQDGEILIVNRSEEVHLSELDFEINASIKTIYESLLQNVYPKEQLYTAEKRAIILIGQTKIWTSSSVANYFKIKGLQIKFTQKNKFEVSQGILGRYKRNYILLYRQGETLNTQNQQEWPLWDTKASASIVQLSNPLKSTNIYFKSDNTVLYQTKYGTIGKGAKLDDEDLFAQVIPSKASNYHFFEKDYAQQVGLLKESSPLNNWIESGMVLFEYEGVPCIISDYLKMQDPIQVLTQDNESNLTDKHYQQVELTTNFPSNKTTGFYVSMIADKVLLSENKSTLDHILADYEIGNTLALNKEKSSLIYGKLPKKVSERSVTKNKTYTLTTYKNLLITTQLEQERSEIKDEIIEQKNRSFGLLGKAKYLLGTNDIIYCFTDANQILAFKNKKQLWKIQFEGELIGSPKLIDLNQNGNIQLLFNTDQKIYLLNNQGGYVNDFPLTCPSHASVSLYRWNGKTNFLIVNTANNLVHIDDQGRVIRKLPLKTGEVINEVSVYRQGKILTAIVNGADKLQVVDIERHKILKTQNQIPSAEHTLKQANTYYFYSLIQQQLSGIDLEGKQKNVLGISEIKKVKKMYRGDEAFLAAYNKNTVALVFSDGSIKLIKTSVSDIEDIAVLNAKNGNLYLAVLDGIENNIYLYDSNSKQISQESLEGKDLVNLSENGVGLTITTLLQNSLVQYYNITLK